MGMVSDIFESYMAALSQPVNNGGLGITVILGDPREGRTEPTLPIAALVFGSDNYLGSPAPVNRVGQTAPAGNEVTAQLYVYAETEYDLLNLVDVLRGVKLAATGLIVQNRRIVVRYGPTQRADYAGFEESMANYVVVSVLFSWI